MKDINEIDTILGILEQKKKEDEKKAETDKRIAATIKGTQEAIARLEHEENNPYLGWYGPDGKPLTEKQYRQMMDIYRKSTIKSEIHTNKATLIDQTMRFIKKNKAAIAGTLATVAIAIATFGNVFGPSLKANKQMTDLSDNFGEKLVKLNYCKQRDNMFSDFKLTISPNKFVNNLGLTADSHMRLYILSTILNYADFESILWELGFNGKEDYLLRLGFKHGEQRAGEKYSNEYEKKLKDIIVYLNENPEQFDIYVDKYPELGFIYDPNNTYIVEGKIFTTRSYGGR